MVGRAFAILHNGVRRCGLLTTNVRNHQEKVMQFTEENIAALFGHEAAEDEDIERLKSYYLKGHTFSQVSNNLPIRILVGHKGMALLHKSE